MFAQTIKDEIEEFTSQFLTENPFPRAAEQGQLQKSDLIRYIRNCLYAVRHTPRHLIQAASCAKSRGEKSVSQFMEQKFCEEQGHDAWAIEDLGHFKVAVREDEDLDVTEANKELLAFAGHLTLSDPMSYMAYITFIEHFTVLAAPSFLNSLERVGIPRNSLTIVAHHAELDKDHVVDDLKAIAEIVVSEVQQKRFIDVLRKTAILIDHHFKTLVEVP